MVVLLSLVPRRRAQAHPPLDGGAAQVLLKDAEAVVAAEVGPQPQADHHRPVQFPGLFQNVLHPHHHVAGGVGLRLLRRDAVLLPVEGLGIAQLHGDDLPVGGRADEVVDAPPGGHRGQEGAVARLVPLGHHLVGSLGGQGGGDVLAGVLPAVDEALGRLPLLRRLVEEIADLAGAVLIAEHRLGVVDAGVHEAQKYPPPLQVQVGLVLDLDDPRRLQGGPVQKPQDHGGGADEAGTHGVHQLGEVLPLHVAEHIPAGEDLGHHHLPAGPDVVEEGVAGPGDEVHRVRGLDEGPQLGGDRHHTALLSRWLTSSRMVPHRYSFP